MAPNVGALGLGMHLAVVDHHDVEHGADHWMDLSDLARAATHCHHHETEAAPEHDHDSLVDGSTPKLRLSAQWAGVLALHTPVLNAPADRVPVDRCHRRGPPTSLFTAHCSLLI